MSVFLAPFVYNAVVLSVHDGDTINVRWDWGRRRYDDPQPIRVMLPKLPGKAQLGISALELAEPGGPETLAYLAAMLPPDTPLALFTAKDDKFAPRVDASISYLDSTGALVDLGTGLVRDGWALPWDGRGPAPKPVWPHP